MLLSELISRQAEYDIDTAWLLRQIRRMSPRDEFLNAESEVIMLLPEFRTNRQGGVLKIGTNIVGAGSGKGWLNGEIGPWNAMKPKIAAFLGGGQTVVQIQKKTIEPVVEHLEIKTTPIPDEWEGTDMSSPAAVRKRNSELNEKHNGPVDSRKTWINYALKKKISEKMAERAEKLASAM